MRLETIILAIAVLPLAACAGTRPPAPSTSPPVAQQATPEVATAELDRRAQRKQVRCEELVMTGSRLRQRVCLTEGEWEEWEIRSREMVRHMQGPRTPGQN